MLKKLFWVCREWHFIRTQYPALLRLYQLPGSLWPACYLNCGWIEQHRSYGLDPLDLGTSYTLNTFVYQAHHMYQSILFSRYETNQVLQTVPHTPSHLHSPPNSIYSVCSSPPSFVQPQGDVSPFSVSSG